MRKKNNRQKSSRKAAGAAAVLLAAGLFLGGCSVSEISEIVEEVRELLPGHTQTEPAAEQPAEEEPEQGAPAEPETVSSGSDTEKSSGLSDLFSLFSPDHREEYQDFLPEGESLFRNVYRTGYYYSCLPAEEQAIYEALLAVTDDPTSMEYRKGIRTSADPQTDAFSDEVARAYQAMIFDHPERFWFREENGAFGYYYPSVPDRNGEYHVMFKLLTTYPEYEEEMQLFNAAADRFLADIDLSQPQPQVALQIHDKLMDTVTYDKALADVYLGTEDMVFDYGYTAYGALVSNSRGEACTAVCDGYSYAYEYLLQQAGITATRVGGMAGEAEGGVYPHSWNLVLLDGEWYETDVTWDDREYTADPNDPAYDLFMEAMQDPVYWGRIRHHLYGLTTEEMARFTPDDSYTYYTDYGYASFLGSSVHIRDTEAGAGREDMLSYLAPVAEGTAYSYDAMTGWGG